jgi:hypothetical protein
MPLPEQTGFWRQLRAAWPYVGSVPVRRADVQNRGRQIFNFGPSERGRSEKANTSPHFGPEVRLAERSGQRVS